MIEDLLNELWATSTGLPPEKQLPVVLRGLYHAALGCDDPRSGVWLELFKDLRKVSSPMPHSLVDWDKLKEELIETARDALDDAVDLALDNHKRGER